MSASSATRKWWKPGPRLRRLLRIGEHFLAAVGLTTIVYYSCFEVSVIVSGSMAPALRGTNVETGDWVLTEKVSYWFRKPARWEIVAFRSDIGQEVMKRVVGLPGESVQMHDRTELRIDGVPAKFPDHIPSVSYLAYGNLVSAKSVPCGEGYYVLGDDSRDSDDSRFSGPISEQRIRGRAWMIVWPLSRWGPVR